MLLERLRIPFETICPEIDETPLPNEAPYEMSVRLAQHKALAVAAHFPEALIIGSDQVAHLNGKIFGKPGTPENAVRQLSQMSGQTVIFNTALALLNTKTRQLRHESVPTQVRFRTLSDTEIQRYVEKERPLDCAGSAKSEGLGISLLEAITCDDPTALIGLPLIALSKLLREEGIELP